MFSTSLILNLITSESKCYKDCSFWYLQGLYFRDNLSTADAPESRFVKGKNQEKEELRAISVFA